MKVIKLKNVTTKIALVVGCLLFVAISQGYFINIVLGQKSTINNNSKGNQRSDAPETSVITVPNVGDFKNLNNSKTSNIAPAIGTDLGEETEPNNTFATANVLTGSEVKIRGDIYPNADEDWYSFTASPGDRVYAAVMTSYSASGSTDSQLRIFEADGTTLVEFDDNDGSQSTTSSSIAGAVLTAGGTYFVRVNHFSATAQLRPYELYLKVQSGSPTPEVEANDTPATANILPASGWVSGARNPAVATEQDWYSFTANAGDTVFLSLDLDPERDVTTWNGRLGIGLFGDANNQILVVDDNGATDTIDSEAMFMTVKNTGTYFAFVDSATATTGGPTATYNLSVTIIPRVNIGVNCTTYTSTDVPQVIPTGPGIVSSTLTVPPTTGRIASTKVSITADHAFMADLDVNLRSPNSNNNALFNDIGSAATGGQTMMDLILDQYSSGVPFAFTVVRPMVLKPELNYRLDWFDGENPSGVWTLDIRDDATGDGGNLTAWSLEICEQPPVPGTLIYNEDFEANDGGYTHSGIQDEWEYGTPATVATTTANPIADFLTCNSGTSCWKTDLDNTYNASSNQELISPPIVLPNLDGTLNLSWAMRYQMESATFDHAFVEIREVGGMGLIKRVWEWKGATMTVTAGNPTVNIGESAGWGTYHGNLDDFANFAGRTIQIVFHVDSDTTVQFGGMAIDDVQLRFVPTVAASVSVGGRVLDQKGSGIPRALVTITDSNGVSRTTTASVLGHYRFDDIQAGQSYTVNVRRKGYQFNPQFISVFDGIDDLNIIAEP